MIYMDTSSLLKLIFADECSDEVGMAVAREKAVVVSVLAELEAMVQIKAKHLGGLVTAAGSARMIDRLSEVLASEPFHRKDQAGSVFRTALQQHQAAEVHCRSLDRLHLAAMVELGIRRLMTHDARQADAARLLGHTVLSPGL